MGYRQWTSGQLVTAPDFQTLIQDQTVAVFASVAARTAAWPTPPSGAMSYLQDLDQVQRWATGKGWQPIAGRMPYARVGFGAGNAAAGWTRRGAPTTVEAWQITVGGDGGLTVPHTGWYRMALNITLDAGAILQGRAGIGITNPGDVIQGTLGPNATGFAGAGTSAYVAVAATRMTAGQTVYAYSNGHIAHYFVGGDMEIAYTYPL